MSRLLDLGENYYTSNFVGRWPIRWYAPECIELHKFSSKSDVWSFGVTMWETFSNCERPYAGMESIELCEFFETGGRLLRPKRCPRELYDLMCDCWGYE